MSTSQSEDKADAKWFEFGNVNAYINHEVVPHFLKSGTVISASDYHRRLDLNKALWHIQLINNSDKGNGNTLLLSSQATGYRIKCPQYLNVNHEKEFIGKESMMYSLLIHYTSFVI